MPGTTVLVIASWAVFGAGLAVLCFRLLKSRR